MQTCERAVDGEPTNVKAERVLQQREGEKIDKRRIDKSTINSNSTKLKKDKSERTGWRMES